MVTGTAEEINTVAAACMIKPGSSFIHSFIAFVLIVHQRRSSVISAGHRMGIKETLSALTWPPDGCSGISRELEIYSGSELGSFGNDIMLSKHPNNTRSPGGAGCVYV
jgi:hypothetical protein